MPTEPRPLDGADYCCPPPTAEDVTITFARLLHRLVTNCTCGQFDNNDLTNARELTWRLAAHGHVLVDVDYLDMVTTDRTGDTY